MTYSLPRKLPSLPKGQLYSMAAYALIIVDGVNSLLQQAQVAHVPLPLWVSALAIPAGAGMHNLLARSLNRSKSGTGSGVIGTPIVDPLAAPITLTPAANANSTANGGPATITLKVSDGSNVTFETFTLDVQAVMAALKAAVDDAGF